MFLLDANTLIHYFRDKGNIGGHLRRIAPSEIGIPAVVLYELEVGAIQSRNPERRFRDLHALVRSSHVVPFGSDAASAAAIVRDILERRGVGIGPIEYLVAGTAVAAKATLVTRNTAGFKRVPGLKIVDWY